MEILGICVGKDFLYFVDFFVVVVFEVFENVVGYVVGVVY